MLGELPDLGGVDLPNLLGTSEDFKNELKTEVMPGSIQATSEIGYGHESHAGYYNPHLLQQYHAQHCPPQMNPHNVMNHPAYSVNPHNPYPTHHWPNTHRYPQPTNQNNQHIMSWRIQV